MLFLAIRDISMSNNNETPHIKCESGSTTERTKFAWIHSQFYFGTHILNATI